MKNNAVNGNRIQGLADFIAAQANDSLPPVENWDPPYCGDIGLAIQADGTWVCQESPIQRKAMVKLFSRILRRDPDGRYCLVTPVEKIYIEVADAPFLAVEMQVEGEGPGQRLIFRTNVDDIVVCGPDNPLRFTEESGHGGLKPYLRVRGHLDALVTRALSYDLFDLARPQRQEADTLFIWSGGACFTVAAS